jgi:RNA polymerase sigma factor (sigma-70 family)
MMETLRPTEGPGTPISFGAEIISEYLDLTESVIAFVIARHRLPKEEAEDFAATVRLRLLERDCAILRKFEGRSSLRTFLTVVIVRLYKDYRTAQWGRWRPSAQARRLGPQAMQLERLMSRDGLTFEEAAETLRAGFGVSATIEVMGEWRARLPVRRQRRPVHFDNLDELVVAPPSPLPVPVLQAQAERALGALRRAVHRSSPEERRMLTLIFANQLTVANTARRCLLDPKRCYRRLARLLNRLRDDVQNAGITATDVSAWIGRADIDTSATAFLEPMNEPD